MSLILPRLIPAALGLALAILTLVLTAARGKKRPAGVVLRAFSVLGALGSVVLIVHQSSQILTAKWNAVLWILLGAALLAQFALLALDKPSRLVPFVQLVAAPVLVSFAQLALAVYYLVTRWKNLSVGEPLWLNIQIALAVLLLIDQTLFDISFVKAKKGKET